MTEHPPDDTDPAERQRSAAEIDAQFAVIVAAMSGSMVWDSSDEPPTGPGGPPPTPAGSGRQGGVVPSSGHPGAPIASDEGTDAAEVAAAAERDRRRALRKALRAEEVALFAAAQADAEAELLADDAHFTPPDPPPVPRPGRRTVVALLLMALGLFLLLRPGLLQVGADVVLVLAMTCLVGGFGILVWGLRPHASDPDDADGWDDGARL